MVRVAPRIDLCFPMVIANPFAMQIADLRMALQTDEEMTIGMTLQLACVSPCAGPFASVRSQAHLQGHARGDYDLANNQSSDRPNDWWDTRCEWPCALLL